MKHNHESLKYKMMKNPSRVYKDLKQKQKMKISNWLYTETYWFYQKHDRMPDKSERKVILNTVYAKIKGAAIWIPYEEIEKYYQSRLEQYEIRIQREIAENVTYPTRAERKAAKAEKQKKPKRCKKKKKVVSDYDDTFDFMDDRFAFIAGYTSGGAPYGLQWEDVGIPSELPFEVKVALYNGEFFDGNDDIEDIE